MRTSDGGKLALLCASRFGSGMAMMAYAGSLPHVLEPWSMTATQAGSVQSTFNMAYALSLLLASWLSDRLGAKRVFVASIWGSAVLFAAFAAFARSYESALVLYALVAIALGGSYTPSIMLVADAVPPQGRGRAIGWTLAAASMGYVAAIATTGAAALAIGYEFGFYAAVAGPALGAVAGSLALRATPNLVHRRSAPAQEGGSVIDALRSRRSVLLTTGYTMHCWELLGMWAWAPAFLTVALSGKIQAGPVAQGLLVAASIHFAGVLATLTMGEASDRLGRRVILIATAAAGACLSFVFGFGADLAAPALLMLAFAYGFATLGDSGVLSTAMTEAVHPKHLGTLLGLRSIVGFGAGAVSPVVFGWVLDAAPAGGPGNWGPAFAVLGCGGAVAALCAWALPPDRAAGRAPRLAQGPIASPRTEEHPPNARPEP